MAIKRSIRLKEAGVSLRKFQYPPGNYLIGREGLSTGYGYALVTDQNGFSLTTIPALSEDRQIFFAGGSSVEASYCDINKRIPFLFQEKMLLAGVSCSCFNMGVSGATTLNLFNSILNKLSNQKGGDLVFFIPSNDAMALDFELGYLNGTRYYANLVPGLIGGQSSGCFEKNKNKIISMLKILKCFCDEIGFNLYISGVIHKNPDLRFSSINRMVQNFCANEGVEYISISDYPDGAFYDSVHLTSKGCEYVAQRVFDEFLVGGLKVGESRVKKTGVELDKASCFDLVRGSSVSLFVDIECFGKTMHSSFLAYFDFFELRDFDSTELSFSGIKISNIVGFYKYLDLPGVGQRCVMQYTFRFPAKVRRVGIGLKQWNSKSNYVVHSAVAYHRI